jgi:hypothetical protein
MKHFLLLAGHDYYPKSSTEDWVGCFSSREEALSKVSVIEHKRTLTKGKNKGLEVVASRSYQIGDRVVDWYEIIDLTSWMGE